jgi:hypothetical protein
MNLDVTASIHVPSAFRNALILLVATSRSAVNLAISQATSGHPYWFGFDWHSVHCVPGKLISSCRSAVDTKKAAQGTAFRTLSFLSNLLRF